MGLKIVFIGNCQAQALTSLSGFYGLEFECLSVPPVWEIVPNDLEMIDDVFNKATLIFSQRLSENYPVEFLRNSKLKERYGDKVAIWPNIYFDGYFPGLMYLYNSEGKVEGPLRDYHFSWIIDGWKAGASVSDIAEIGTNYAQWSGPLDPVERSFLELRMREADVDVPISDYLIDRFRHKKLFHSMNHPHHTVLTEMLRRLLAFANLSVPLPDASAFPYQLNQIDLPTLPVFREIYRPAFQEIKGVKGAEVDFDKLKPRDAIRDYDWPSLVDAYYSIYSLMGK